MILAGSVSEVGEFGLIRRIRELILAEGAQAEGVNLGIGDDTASFSASPGQEILITCDSVVEGRHYLPGRITARDLGRRAMDLNISDIGAMGGLPLYALISLGLRGDLAVQFIEEMYRGFLTELNPFGAAVIGGNITHSGGPLFIDITLLGEVPVGKVVRRSGARVGDAILLTGEPGQAAAGLRLLLSEGGGEGLANHELVRAYHAPGHRAREGRAVALSGCATAMIDTSDGLLGDLGHICEESRVGATLDLESLPVSDVLRQTSHRLGLNPYDLILGDSDDYELIITCAPEDVGMIRGVLAIEGAPRVTQIGRITTEASGIQLVEGGGKTRKVKATGWDHFVH